MERYIVARSKWGVEHLLARVRRGQVLPEAVFLNSEKDAYRVLSHKRPMQQGMYSVFKINWTPKEKE